MLCMTYFKSLKLDICRHFTLRMYFNSIKGIKHRSRAREWQASRWIFGGRFLRVKCGCLFRKVLGKAIIIFSTKYIANQLLWTRANYHYQFFQQEKRRLYHMRHVKVNKIKEIIEKQNANMTPSRRAPQPPSQNPVTSHQVPYNPSMNMMQNNVPSAGPAPPGYRPNVPYR